MLVVGDSVVVVDVGGDPDVVDVVVIVDQLVVVLSTGVFVGLLKKKYIHGINHKIRKSLSRYD